MRTQQRTARLAIWTAAVLALATPAWALDFDFSGTFAKDNDVVRLGFTVGQASTVTIFSSSWDDGGFDPILAIWDGAGSLLYQQDDGGRTGTTYSNGVGYSHGVWDSYYDLYLDPGSYTASIAQYANFANGTNLSDGFWYDNVPNFTQMYGPQSYFNGVWSSNDARTGDWAFHILNVAEAQQLDPVPEPGTLLLLGSGLLGVAGVARRRTRNA